MCDLIFEGKFNDEQLLLDKHRAYRLSDGDIFTVNGTSIEYEDKKFFEVVEAPGDEYAYTRWKRTGITFTMDELNELLVDWNLS